MTTLLFIPVISGTLYSMTKVAFCDRPTYKHTVSAIEQLEVLEMKVV